MQSHDSAGGDGLSGREHFNEYTERLAPTDGGGSRRRRGQSAAIQGAPPSNTAPHTCNSLSFLPLRWGVDSLYLSYPGELFTDAQLKLAELKALAQSDRALDEARAQLVIGEHIFEVKDKGARLFPYILEDATYRIQLSKGGKTTPMAYCKVSSGHLAYRRPAASEAQLAALLSTLGDVHGGSRVSRIDLYVDFCADVAMDGWSREAWITKAKRRDAHAIQDDFSGWSLGLGGAISARLYDKTLELEVSRKDYLRDLWREVGWDGVQPVWRLEVQLNREVLTQFQLSSLDAVLGARSGLWSYAVTEWLRLTIPNPSDQTRSRWPLHPLWIALASVDWEGDGGPLLRQFNNQRVPSVRGLARLGLSIVTSNMALNGTTDFLEGWNALGQEVYGSLTTDAHFEGAHPDSLLLEKVKLKGRRFNTLNNTTAVNDADRAKQEADEAREYGRIYHGS